MPKALPLKPFTFYVSPFTNDKDGLFEHPARGSPVALDARAIEFPPCHNSFSASCKTTSKLKLTDAEWPWADRLRASQNDPSGLYQVGSLLKFPRGLGQYPRFRSVGPRSFGKVGREASQALVAHKVGVKQYVTN